MLDTAPVSSVLNGFVVRHNNASAYKCNVIITDDYMHIESSVNERDKIEFVVTDKPLMS